MRKQDNGNDCGVFVCAYARCLLGLSDVCFCRVQRQPYYTCLFQGAWLERENMAQELTATRILPIIPGSLCMMNSNNMFQIYRPAPCSKHIHIILNHPCTGFQSLSRGTLSDVLRVLNLLSLSKGASYRVSAVVVMVMDHRSKIHLQHTTMAIATYKVFQIFSLIHV